MGAGSSRRATKRPRRLVVAILLVVAAVLVGRGSACSPEYVVRAAWTQAKILRAREPIADVVAAPETDARTRAQLALALEARGFAADALGMDPGDVYTTYARMETDTLALVLSAAPRDRLAPRTWWFPVVGRVPYRGFFDWEEARAEQRELEREGLDTHLRPTAAFSTLGWFSDPLPSTVVGYDEVELVATVLHELSHKHLFVPGQARFNESFATWVGRTGAIDFFCPGERGRPDAERCARARDRWRDARRFSAFLDDLVADLESLYGDSTLTPEDALARRSAVFASHRQRFRDVVQPRLRSLSFAGFAALPWNNATLLGRMRYYHRLDDFQRHLERSSGSLEDAIEALRSRAATVEDPFRLLPADGPRRAFSRVPDGLGREGRASAGLHKPGILP